MKTAALALLTMAACAPANVPKGGEAQDSFRFVGGGASTTARLVEPDLFWSSVGNVQTFNDGFRGQWRGEIVDLRTHDATVEGFIGSQRTELHIRPQQDGYIVDGLYRGHLGQLRVGKEAITGSVGNGWVDVQRIDGDYTGFMPPTAGAERRQRALRLPVKFAALPQEQQALYLALIIGV